MTSARVSQRDTLLELMKTDMQTLLPTRVVQRTLLDPAQIPIKDLQKGVVCVVAAGGGSFANYQGREGELSTVKGSIVGYVQVAERDLPIETERAETALLEEVLDWFGQAHPPGLGSAYPLEYTQSQQMEHPIGWFALRFELRHV